MRARSHTIHGYIVFFITYSLVGWLLQPVVGAQKQEDGDVFNELSKLAEKSGIAGEGAVGVVKSLPRSENKALNQAIETQVRNDVGRIGRISTPEDVADHFSDLANLAQALGDYLQSTVSESARDLRKVAEGVVVPSTDVAAETGSFVCCVCYKSFPYAGKSAAGKLEAIRQSDECMARHLAAGEVSAEQGAQYQARNSQLKRQVEQGEPVTGSGPPSQEAQGGSPPSNQGFGDMVQQVKRDVARDAGFSGLVADASSELQKDRRQTALASTSSAAGTSPNEPLLCRELYFDGRRDLTCRLPRGHAGRHDNLFCNQSYEYGLRTSWCELPRGHVGRHDNLLCNHPRDPGADYPFCFLRRGHEGPHQYPFEFPPLLISVPVEIPLKTHYQNRD